ncbi:hypothetical protein AVEN_194274-1 [Araneus ventricosus]|uniref:Uncharacterized protein n=1 Tax=Araneus ventricosus TaxID=182803 RepID=A0A4Y2G363_ARAVE|nr:hypothetical protein AVEN_194274-1 [Araneus ventricosus]
MRVRRAVDGVLLHVRARSPRGDCSAARGHLSCAGAALHHGSVHALHEGHDHDVRRKSDAGGGRGALQSAQKDSAASSSHHRHWGEMVSSLRSHYYAV